MVYCGIKLSSQSHNKSLFLVYGSQKRLEGLLLLVAMKSGKGSIQAVIMAGEDGKEEASWLLTVESRKVTSDFHSWSAGQSSPMSPT